MRAPSAAKRAGLCSLHCFQGHATPKRAFAEANNHLKSTLKSQLVTNSDVRLVENSSKIHSKKLLSINLL